MVTSYATTVENLIAQFGRLPGIGAKTAERLAHHILKIPAEEALTLAQAIKDAKDNVGQCEVCYHLVEAEHRRCTVCRDERRDARTVCVVETSRDLMALEKSGSYRGVYHVLLGRYAPLQGVGPEQLTLDRLVARVRDDAVREVILATNPNLEGDGTALLVAGRLGPTGAKLTRLARGLASGSTLEFANKEMLADAIEGRQQFS